MHGHIAHFAINADDVPTTRAFYEGLFGWTFQQAYDPQFFRTTSAGEAIGAIQGRRELIPGTRTNGLEVTFSVDDAGDFANTAMELGGRVLMPKATIPGVGDLVFVEDPSGNVVGGMRFDA